MKDILVRCMLEPSLSKAIEASINSLLQAPSRLPSVQLKPSSILKHKIKSDIINLPTSSEYTCLDVTVC